VEPSPLEETIDGPGEGFLRFADGILVGFGAHGEIHVGAPEADVGEASFLLREAVEALQEDAGVFVVVELDAALEPIGSRPSGPGLIRNASVTS